MVPMYSRYFNEDIINTFYYRIHCFERSKFNYDYFVIKLQKAIFTMYSTVLNKVKWVVL